MSLTTTFIENNCRAGCPYYNNLDRSLDRSNLPQGELTSHVERGSQMLLDRGVEVCGYCGCSLSGMKKAGKPCPLGLSGSSRGVWRIFKWVRDRFKGG